MAKKDNQTLADKSKKKKKKLVKLNDKEREGINKLAEIHNDFKRGKK